jgi:hypothetical protein
MCDVEGQWEWWWKDRVVYASVGVIGMGVSMGEGVCVCMMMAKGECKNGQSEEQKVVMQ